MMNSFALQLAVHLFLHGTVVLGVAWVVTRYAPGLSAAGKHTIWVTAFAVLFLLPLGQQMPGWEVDLGLASSAWMSEQTQSPVPSVSEDNRILGPVEQERSGTAPTSTTTGLSTAVSAATDRGAGAAAFHPERVVRWTVHGFLAIWLGGVLLLLGRMGLGMISLRGWKQQAVRMECAEMAQRLARHLALRRSFEVRSTAETPVPIMCGAVNPVIFLPADARSWPQPRLRAVLLHELAHIKRCDYLTHMLGRVVRAFFWPQPLVWKAVERASAAQEQACDDVVLRSGIASWEYAKHLLAIVKTLRQPLPAEAVALHAGRRFKARMQALLQTAPPRRSMTRWERGAIGLAGVSLLISLSVVHLGASSSENYEHHWMEAEYASMPSAFAPKEDQAASQGTYVKVTERAPDLDHPPEVEPAAYRFETARAGQHVVWARVRARSKRHNSLWVQVDSTRWIRWNGIEESGRWHWVQVRDADHGERPVAFDLSAGEHHLMLAPREDKVEIDQLLVTTNWNYQPRGAGEQALREQDHRIDLEAEDGWLQTPWRVKHAPDASGWQHIEARLDDVRLDAPPESGYATYSFTVPRDGVYRLWGRVIAKNNDSDSFWVRMNDGQWIRWNGIAQGERWHWDEVHNADHDHEPVRFELAKGTHQLTIAPREPNAKLDRLVLTSDAAYRPRGVGERPDSLIPFSEEIAVAEAELTAPMVLRADSQSVDHRPWIEVPDGPGNDAPEGGSGAATFSFSVPHAGRYVLWGEVEAPHSNDNSFYVSMNGGEEYTWHTPAPGRTTSDWQWAAVSDGAGEDFVNPVIFSLEAGTHTLRIRNREDGTRLRRLRITNMPSAEERLAVH